MEYTKKSILISACLAGENVKYNGKNNKLPEVILQNLQKNYKLIPVCPEVLGNLPVPRPPAEIFNGKVIRKNKEDVTSFFIKGAKKTLKIAKETGVEFAIFKESSPSCGVNTIYDGTFSKTKIKAQGITTKILKENNIEVISEDDLSSINFDTQIL